MRLRTKDKFSSWQITVLFVASGIGSQIILAPNSLIVKAEQGAWISVVLGSGVYFAAAWLMLKLAERYPDKTLVEYLPLIWGKPLGLLLTMVYVFIFIAQVVLVLRGFSRAIVYSMFSRTPEEAIAIVFLGLIAYGAVQSWGVIVRIQQFLLFTAVPVGLVIWCLSVLSFQLENILPLLPDDPKVILAGIPLTWNFFSGYEMILLIYPLLYRQNLKYSKAIAAAFGVMGVFFTVIVVVTIGVLSVKAAQNLTYPTLAAIKGVEIPGTFLERLELYLILLWIPIVFDTHVAFLAIAAFTLTAVTGYATHRRWVLFLLPPTFAAFYYIEAIGTVETAGKIVTYTGVAFSFAIVPLTLALSYLKRRQATE